MPAHHNNIKKNLISSLLIVSFASLAVHFLHKGPWLFSTEAAILDAWINLHRDIEHSNIVIITIQESDYQKLFNSTSPLSPETINMIIESIASGKPKVIGVDIDTSHPAFRRLNPGTRGVPIVWARDAIIGNGLDTAVIPLPYLGRLASKGLYGISLFPQDSDGIVRQYQSCFKLAKGTAPSFGSHLAAKLRNRKLACRDPGDLILNFSGDRYAFDHISVSDILHASRGQGWENSGPLRGKLVILGGTYRASRDEYVTPIGPMSGVELMATAIETELRGGGIKTADKWLSILLELLAGILLIATHYYLSPAKALLTGLILIPLGAMLISLIAYSSLGYWLNSIPVLAAIFIHQIYESAKESSEPKAAASAQSLANVPRTPPSGPGRETAKNPSQPIALLVGLLAGAFLATKHYRKYGSLLTKPRQ